MQLFRRCLGKRVFGHFADCCLMYATEKIAFCIKFRPMLHTMMFGKDAQNPLNGSLPCFLSTSLTRVAHDGKGN